MLLLKLRAAESQSLSKISCRIRKDKNLWTWKPGVESCTDVASAAGSVITPEINSKVLFYLRYRVL